MKVQLQFQTPQTTNRTQVSSQKTKPDNIDMELRFSELWQEIGMKANIKDVCALVDTKANIQDVNQSLEALDKKWQGDSTYRGSVSEVSNFATNNQKFINDSLCALNCVAKWVWFGGFTSLSGITHSVSGVSHNKKDSFGFSAFDRCSNESADAIKWSKEVINTSPDNFELNTIQDDSGAIVIRQAGVYEVLFAFFLPSAFFVDEKAENRPSIQMRLDGRPVLSTFDINPNVFYHMPEHKCVSLQTFLQVDDMRRLSLTISRASLQAYLAEKDYMYQSDLTKGFCSIRKL